MSIGQPSQTGHNSDIPHRTSSWAARTRSARTHWSGRRETSSSAAASRSECCARAETSSSCKRSRPRERSRRAGFQAPGWLGKTARARSRGGIRSVRLTPCRPKRRSRNSRDWRTKSSVRSPLYRDQSSIAHQRKVWVVVREFVVEGSSTAHDVEVKFTNNSDISNACFAKVCWRCWWLLM